MGGKGSQTIVTESPVCAVIPLAAKSVVADWTRTCGLLEQTLRSVLAMPADFLSVLVIGHDEPAGMIPWQGRVRFVRVEFDPPDHEGGSRARIADKGKKLRIGVIEAKRDGATWVMPVDADDLLSCRLPRLCNLDACDAVCFGSGYLWRDDSQWVRRLGNFHRVCGTSWIMRLNATLFPAWLGNEDRRVCDASHADRFANLKSIGANLQVLRTPVAIYRQSGASLSSDAPYKNKRRRSLRSTQAWRVLRSVKALSQTRMVSRQIRQEFGMDAIDK